MTSAEWTSSSACHELLCSRAFLFIALRSAQHPQIPRFLQIFLGIWPMPLSLLNHSALALFAQRTRIPTSARSIGFCAIWVCISSSSQLQIADADCVASAVLAVHLLLRFAYSGLFRSTPRMQAPKKPKSETKTPDIRDLVFLRLSCIVFCDL